MTVHFPFQNTYSALPANFFARVAPTPVTSPRLIKLNRPLAVSLPTRQCTVDKVTALKQVLARHPGTSQVHLRLISGERITTLELDSSLRVTPSSALMGDLKALLGPGCLG